MSTITKAMIGVAALVAIIGIIILINGKTQQSDPTFAKAPPPGPGAVTLHPSGAKAQHQGPMYTVTSAGVTVNQPGTGQAAPVPIAH